MRLMGTLAKSFPRRRESSDSFKALDSRLRGSDGINLVQRFLSRNHLILLLWLVLAAVSSTTAARELRPFVPGSMEAIVAKHSQRAFILAFWSLTCPPCRDELALFGTLQRQHPGIDIVLVSTDAPEETAAIHATLDEFKLAQVEAWVFADSFADRLRFEVDKKWHGELPRTYFFAPGETRKAYSGKLHASDIARWIKNAGRR